MKTKIEIKLSSGKPLTKKEIVYAKKLLPNFQCDCNICRLNLGLQIGMDFRDVLQN